MWIINDKFENKQNNFLKLEKKERNGSFTNDEKSKWKKRHHLSTSHVKLKKIAL